MQICNRPEIGPCSAQERQDVLTSKRSDCSYCIHCIGRAVLLYNCCIVLLIREMLANLAMYICWRAGCLPNLDCSYCIHRIRVAVLLHNSSIVLLIRDMAKTCRYQNDIFLASCILLQGLPCRSVGVRDVYQNPDCSYCIHRLFVLHTQIADIASVPRRCYTTVLLFC